jgi:hypothetical protein
LLKKASWATFLGVVAADGQLDNGDYGPTIRGHFSFLDARQRNWPLL